MFHAFGDYSQISDLVPYSIAVRMIMSKISQFYLDVCCFSFWCMCILYWFTYGSLNEIWFAFLLDLQTALMQACRYGHWEVVQTLLLFRCNVSMSTSLIYCVHVGEIQSLHCSFFSPSFCLLVIFELLYHMEAIDIGLIVESWNYVLDGKGIIGLQVYFPVYILKVSFQEEPDLANLITGYESRLSQWEDSSTLCSHQWTCKMHQTCCCRFCSKCSFWIFTCSHGCGRWWIKCEKHTWTKVCLSFSLS